MSRSTIRTVRSLLRTASAQTCAAFALLSLTHCAAPTEEGERVIHDPDLSVAPASSVTTEDGRLRIEARTSPDQPPTRGLSTVALVAVDADTGEPVDDLDLNALPWMPAMGHGTKVKTEIEAQGAGVYMVRRVNMYMGGEWDLRLSVEGSSDERATLRFSIR